MSKLFDKNRLRKKQKIYKRLRSKHFLIKVFWKIQTFFFWKTGLPEKPEYSENRETSENFFFDSLIKFSTSPYKKIKNLILWCYVTWHHNIKLRDITYVPNLRFTNFYFNKSLDNIFKNEFKNLALWLLIILSIR